ncbi:MAG: hypothetical protein LJE93_08090 [Acidobacteria bacterium]|jgi:hypothetical protein|nr:hypothetical protein [Acidobacteriota bacterium]
MKKTMMASGVVFCAALLVSPAMADNCSKDKQVSNEGSSCAKTTAVHANAEGVSCSKSAAKAAYAKALEETGCENTARAAYNNTLAENTYAQSFAATGCSKTAQKASYEAVYASTSCEKTSQVAATHAVAQATYDATLAKTGCEKTAEAAYASMIKTAGSSCDLTGVKASCDKSEAKTTSGQVADASEKLASNQTGSSR